MIQTYLLVLAVVLGLSVGFALLEWHFPAERGQPVAAWLFNLAYTPFILGFALILGLILAPLFALLLGLFGGGLLPPLTGEGSSPISHVLFALGYAFMWDFCQYWLHRMQHGIPLLWETHKFHHDEVALNAVVQARVHPTGYLLTALFHIPVLILLGSQAPHFVAAFVMFTLWGFVNHANLRLSFGPLTPWLAGPQWHRIHHSIREEHRDRNFAVMFPVIDWLFGTYYRPGRNEFPPTGLPGERTPSLRGATVEPFLGWYRMLKRVRPAE